MSFPKTGIFKAVGIGRRAIGVVGVRGEVRDAGSTFARLSEIAEKHGVVAQAFDGGVVAGAKHLVHAARSAVLAQERECGFTNSLEVELLCWAGAERQIGRAIKKMGLKPSLQELALVCVGGSNTKVKRFFKETIGSLNLELDPKVLELNRKKESKIKKAFLITPRELEVTSLEKLVMERVSSLGIR